MATIERLTKRPDFLAAAEGRRFHTERMTAQGRLCAAPPDAAAPGARAGGLRLGFTITKRVGHATERNRIRRRLRAAVTLVAADLPADLARLPADIVLIARRPALDAAFETLADDVRRAIGTVTRPRAPGAPPGGRSGSRPRKRDAGAAPTPGRADIAPSQERATDRRARDHRLAGEPRSDGTGADPVATPNACGGVPDGQ